MHVDSGDTASLVETLGSVQLESNSSADATIIAVDVPMDPLEEELPEQPLPIINLHTSEPALTGPEVTADAVVANMQPTDGADHLERQSQIPNLQTAVQVEIAVAVATKMQTLDVSDIDPTDVRQASDSRQAVALELCCRSAGFSAAMSARGFKCIAVDHSRNRFKAKHAITMLDLEKKESVSILCSVIDQGNVSTLLMGPPCGTASRAREIQLSAQQLRQIGGKAPVQLRSEAEPWGLSTLEGTDKAKVAAANRVYVNLGLILMHALTRGVKPLVENPRGSYLWLLWPFCILIELWGFIDIDFQHCRHGGARPKWTRFRTLLFELLPMAGLCPGLSTLHKHKPWGLSFEAGRTKFATSEETEYPRLMCDNMADGAVVSATAMGFSGLGINLNPDVHDASAMQLRRMAGSADRSNGGRKPVPLISEFREVITVLPAAVDAKRHRILRSTVCKGSDGSIESVTVGVFREPEKFLEEALKVSHPVDSLIAIPPGLIDNIDWLLREGPSSVCKFRLGFVKELVKLCKDNASADLEVLASLSASQGKNYCR